MGSRHLQAAEFLYETSLFPELAYTFKHALTHEVAYGSLLQERRRGLHARIVEALEALYPNRLAEQVERLAHHAFRGEMWDKAAHLLSSRPEPRRAAVPPTGRPSRASSRRWQALTHLPESRSTLEQGIDLRISLRTALLPLGENSADPRPPARCRNPRRGPGRSASPGADLRPLMPRFLADGRLWSSPRVRPAGPGDQHGPRGCQPAIATNVRLANTYQALGDYGRAIACCRTAVSLEGVLPPPPVSPTGRSDVNSRARLSQCMAELGAFAEGIPTVKKGSGWLRRAIIHSAVPARMAVSATYTSTKGTPTRPFPVLEQGVELCQVWQIQFYFPHVASPLGLAYALSGRVAEACRCWSRRWSRPSPWGSCPMYPGVSPR